MTKQREEKDNYIIWLCSGQYSQNRNHINTSKLRFFKPSVDKAHNFCSDKNRMHAPQVICKYKLCEERRAKGRRRATESITLIFHPTQCESEGRQFRMHLCCSELKSSRRDVRDGGCGQSGKRSRCATIFCPDTKSVATVSSTQKECFRTVVALERKWLPPQKCAL